MTVDPPPLRSLGIIATRGSSNNLFQVATLVRAATALGASVEVLFRDSALAKLSHDRIDVPEWSATYAAVEPKLRERLKAAEFTSMESFLRDAKEHGDDVRFWASSQTMETDGLRLADLTSLLDGAVSPESFDERATRFEALLSF
ncbi:MAG TPA: hypothetical protein VFC51_17330 [Chloroflexota bacterium]|nr:hypothetical protein [Chloroflexota bacterium]